MAALKLEGASEKLDLRTSFTLLECERFRNLCNFTEEERAVFDLRVQGKSVTEIYFALCDTPLSMSERTIERRIRSIKRKIIKAI